MNVNHIKFKNIKFNYLESRYIKSNYIFFLFTFVFITVILILSIYNPIQPFTNSNAIIIFFFFVTAGINLGFIYDLFKKIGKKIYNIQTASEFLNTIDKNNIENEIMLISKKFNELELGEVWEQFNQTIRKIPGGESIEGEITYKYYSTVDANYFFNEDWMLSDINNRLHNNMPSLLTAIGILGTFLGLILGLQNLDLNGDINNTKSSIATLILGIKFSFKASLYGVTHSIMLTIYEKWYVGHSEISIGKLASKLDSLFPKNTQEDGIKEIYIELEKQTASMQKLSTDFAEEVGKKLDNSFQVNLTPILYKLRDATEKLVDLTKNNTMAEDIGKNFNLSIQQTLVPTMEKLGQAAEKLAAISETSNEKAINGLIQNIGEMFSTATGSEMDRLKSSLGELTSKNEIMFDKFSGAVEQIQKMMEHQRSVITETNSSANNVERTNEKMEDLTGKLEVVLSSLVDFSQTQQMSNVDHRNLLDEIRLHIEYQNQSTSMISDMLKKTTDTLELQDKTFSELKESTVNLNNFNSAFKSVLESITSNVEYFEKVSDSTNEKFMTTILNLDGYYSQINEVSENMIGLFNSSIGQLKNDVIANLNNINDKFIDITDRLNIFSNTSYDLTRSFNEFAATQAISQELWKTYKTSFEDLNHTINDSMIDYTSNVRNGLNDIFRQYDEHLHAVLDKLNNTMEELKDNIEDLTEVYDKSIEG